MTPEQKAHALTDDALEALERRVSGVYAQAGKDMEEKLNAYTAQFKRLDEQKKALVEAGKLTQKEYEQWRLNKVAVGKLWEAKRNNLAQDYLNADKIAYGIVNGELPNVYALNHNYTAYALESQTNMNLQFTLYDRASVERLLKENRNLLPLKEIKDGAMTQKIIRWNEQKVQSAVMQGLLQGESIPNIAKRLEQVTEMNKNSAIRNARTAVTGAENAGRQDTYNEAVSKGIKLKKEWLATLDGRTRHSHAALDGEHVDTDKKFSNGCRYPGDPQGPPAEVYNCRCTLIAHLPDVDTSDAQRRARNLETGENEIVQNMTYQEWEKSKNEKLSDNIEPISRERLIQKIKELGFASKVDLGGLDREDVEIVQKTISEIQKKYPDMPDVPTITYDASARFYGAMDNAALLPDGRFTGQQLTIGNIKGNEELFVRTLWHEYGHLYINKLNANGWVNKMQGDWFTKYADGVIKQSYSNEILKKVRAEMKKDGLRFDVIKISDYAAKNAKSKPNEVIAEAFSIFNTSGENVSEEIKYIMKYLR
jgi:SPP1 gp7 family putative phage head morphogenesis protein